MFRIKGHTVVNLHYFCAPQLGNMDRLNEIKKPLEREFSEYTEFIKRVLHSDDPFVSGIMDYIISSHGKGIRPLLVFLCAGIHSKTGIGKRSYLAAMLVEMIHNASLIHDDVVDGSDTRHGKPTVHSKWNSRVSVLSGDYILARSYVIGMRSAQYDIVSYITDGIAELVEGELIQSELNEKRVVTRQSYLDIIFKKTATLIGVSSGSGAMSAGANPTEVGLARQIGLNLGMAFQIKDDILDYAPSEQTGKSSCADLREGKVTLPLIAILERCGKTECQTIMDKVKAAGSNPELIEEISAFVHKEGGIEAAKAVMNSYLDAARSVIRTYPESTYRHSLELLCDYIGDREK